MDLLPVGDRDRVYELWYDPAAPFFEGHYPHYPIVPGVFLVEAAARAVARASGDDTVVVARVDRARFLRPVHPGDTITISVIDLEQTEGQVRAKVVVSVGEERAATVTLRMVRGEPALGPAPGGSVTTGVQLFDVLGVLPHRRPMLCIDGVEVLDTEHIVARTMVSVNSLGLWGRATTQALPTALVIESWCQAAGVLAAQSRTWAETPAQEVMLFGGLSAIEVGAAARPGQVLVHHARFTFHGPGITLLEGWSEIDGELALRVESVTLAVRPARELSAREPEKASVGQ